MRVIATEHPVPLLPTEGQPGGGFIEPAPAGPVNVPEHSYYHRRIASGELKAVAEDQPSTVSPTKGGAKSTAKEATK
ncbi:hypothetical protein ACQKPE_16220 [Pseudomonas sp. NPDC089554]|uniref:hypothetical protein n=1 Tax=Pseudomonas sp. NPDC089554 TaxID=3390653 RepID=UPI003D03F677